MILRYIAERREHWSALGRYSARDGYRGNLEDHPTVRMLTERLVGRLSRIYRTDLAFRDAVSRVQAAQRAIERHDRMVAAPVYPEGDTDIARKVAAARQADHQRDGRARRAELEEQLAAANDVRAQAQADVIDLMHNEATIGRDPISELISGFNTERGRNPRSGEPLGPIPEDFIARLIRQAVAQPDLT